MDKNVAQLSFSINRKFRRILDSLDHRYYPKVDPASFIPEYLAKKRSYKKRLQKLKAAGFVGMVIPKKGLIGVSLDFQ